MRAVLIVVLVVSACAEEATVEPTDTGPSDLGAGDAGATDEGPAAEVEAGDYAAAWQAVRPIIEAKCARCHTADRLSTYRRLETHVDVTGLRGSILDKTSPDPPRGLRMPVASNHVGAEGCVPEHPAVNDKRLTEGELALLVDFLERTDHWNYLDTLPPITAPEVPKLSGAVEYVSSQFDVVNDGFITPPSGVPPEYMHEYGYDERDLDQMEDDWFCIEFDPMRTEPGYLTGVQVETEIGQIFLNAQLVIDTTGGSAAAKAAADEKGPDWYRCDAGLGFADALPLWRTVPGGGAVELPADTGLRFEPGWRFILRADFHTHFDGGEFERLDQKGVIDKEAGTMTWFNSATLRARWAEPAAISRELRWMRIEPSTQADKQAFVVKPGPSTLSYSASPPAGGSYLVFSAEVEMGKNGYRASLMDTSTSTCVANNSDFDPKWIEQTLYAEGDAPVLTPASVLALECAYRNTGDEGVGWGPEGEATVWGRKERCSALVFFYDE